MLVSLLGAFVQFIHRRTTISTTERYLVVVPISVHAGWVTVATVANISAALWASGITNFILPATVWTCVMTVAAGLIGAAVTVVSRGIITYALTIIWALIGILVANIVIASNLSIAITAGIMAAIVAVALAYARLAKQRLLL